MISRNVIPLLFSPLLPLLSPAPDYLGQDIIDVNNVSPVLGRVSMCWTGGVGGGGGAGGGVV